MKKVLAASATLLISALAFGQTKMPAFEVASIKPNTTNDGRAGLRMGQGGEIIMTNFTLGNIIEFAFDVKGYSLTGPDWLYAESFDVNAKPPAGTPRDQIKPMLQTLLAERFKLVFHRDTKTMQGYALLVAKGGLKIKEVEPVTDQGPGGGRRIQMGGGSLELKQIDLKGFAPILAGQIGQPVADLTEKTGLYDIKLEWTREGRGPDGPDNVEGRPAEATGPTIYTALQEQLGLRLQSQKIPVEIVVVDKIEKVPTEN
jgi:uncharacterized protein (TIGR03435 family)